MWLYTIIVFYKYIYEEKYKNLNKNKHIEDFWIS